jgi:hypothetical protein
MKRTEKLMSIRVSRVADDPQCTVYVRGCTFVPCSFFNYWCQVPASDTSRELRDGIHRHQNMCSPYAVWLSPAFFILFL